MRYIPALVALLFFGLCDIALAAEEDPEMFEVVIGLGILLFILWLGKVLIFGFSSKKSSSKKKKSKKSHDDDDDDDDGDDDNDSDGDSGGSDSGGDSSSDD